MAKSPNQHVVPHSKGWAVQKEAGKKPSAVRPTQRAAIEIGREIARNQQSELIIHGEDGRIRERDSHGHDPRSSKG